MLAAVSTFQLQTTQKQGKANLGCGCFLNDVNDSLPTLTIFFPNVSVNSVLKLYFFLTSARNTADLYMIFLFHQKFNT